MGRTKLLTAACCVVCACAWLGCSTKRPNADQVGAGSGNAGNSNGGAGSTSSNGGSTGHAGGSGAAGQNAAGSGGTAGQAAAGSGGSGAAGTGGSPTANPIDGPAAGNPDGHCTVPAEAQAEDSSHPTTVVGTGTPESCTSAAFVAAVTKGGVITFDCGDQPATITLDQTAKVFNDKGPKIIIDGANKITLSGGGKHRILYQNTCDQAQKWTSPHCDNQDTPQLTVQNLTFVDGNATGEKTSGGGGGAIFVLGGRFKVFNSRFFRNVCDSTGQDVGGAAIRVQQQSQGLPVYIVGCTFGGSAALGNVCSSGGGLSSIGVSYTVVNSLFSYNKAIGTGANGGTPGGGNGGGIYNDGDTYTLTLCGTKLTNNTANEGGGAIFYVSNDLSGSLVIQDSTLQANPSAGFETQGYPGIFVLAKGNPQVTNSTIAK